MAVRIFQSGPYWGPKDLADKLEGGHARSCSQEGGVYMYDSSARYSPRSLLFRQRIIMFTGMVDTGTSESAMEQMLALDSMGKEDNRDIVMYINSPGGMVTEGLVVYDTMQHIKSDVSTVVTGMAGSMASMFLAAGAKGKRYALPNATIMLHEASGGTGGRLSDMLVQNDYINDLFSRFIDIYLKHINRDKDGYFHQFGGETDMDHVTDMKPKKMDDAELKVWFKKWLQKDRFMTAEQAVKLGIIDGIIEGKGKLSK
ncbi:MAG: ATP-dependent Clp protease proteolytic subunit [Nanoarchaeota archaeon]